MTDSKYKPEPQTEALDHPWWCRLSHDADGNPIEDGMAALKVTGSERVEFLNGQLTNDIALLTPDKTMLAGWCNNKGRLMMICQIVDWQDAIWLIMPNRIIESIKQKLQMYVMRADVQLEIAECTIIGMGDGADADTNHEPLSVYADDHAFLMKVAGDPTRSVYVIDGHVDVENEDLDEAPTDYFWLRGIQAMIPRILPETQEAFVAQWCNLDLLDGISFKKGCYIGQEIIARTQNLGTVKRRLVIENHIDEDNQKDILDAAQNGDETIFALQVKKL